MKTDCCRCRSETFEIVPPFHFDLGSRWRKMARKMARKKKKKNLRVVKYHWKSIAAPLLVLHGGSEWTVLEWWRMRAGKMAAT
jgi:hypothetical protein